MRSATYTRMSTENRTRVRRRGRSDTRVAAGAAFLSLTAVVFMGCYEFREAPNGNVYRLNRLNGQVCMIGEVDYSYTEEGDLKKLEPTEKGTVYWCIRAVFWSASNGS